MNYKGTIIFIRLGTTHPKPGSHHLILAQFFFNPHRVKLNISKLHAQVVPCIPAKEGCHANPDSEMERAFHVAP